MIDVKELFLKQKQALRARTREVFALLRPEHLDWRPEGEALSIGEMLRHMAVSEQGVLRLVLSGDFSYYDQRIPHGLRSTFGESRTLPELFDDLDRVHEETIAAVREMRPEKLEEERTKPELNFRRKVYAILFGINEHEIHHRAQIMTYLRMLGSPAPEPFKKA